MRKTSQNVSDVPELFSSQEEVDGRLFLHAKHAASQSIAVLIFANDTDILILCLAFHDLIACNIFIRIKDNSRVCYTDVYHVLLGMHAFTGCDW